MTRASGTEGYAEEAEALLVQYESLVFTHVQRWTLPLIPPPPQRILEIGAGTGRDAAGLAALGHLVIAVEPTQELRNRAAVLHPSPAIEWVDDSLPDLAAVMARGETFDVVMMTAVWMHLDEGQRHRAMPHVARLMRPGGIAFMTLRHGPVPSGRRMFDVTAEETVTLARQAGLDLVSNAWTPEGIQKRPGVSWTRLAFAKPANEAI
jgi:protein-L-isoaspartate O-methyltransferase